MEIQQNAVKVSILYHKSDETVLHDLENHLSTLKQKGLISIWHPGQIPPGINRTEAIDQQLQQAAIIVLLVSANFLASDDCNQIEVKHILERQQAGTARLVPIICRACDWKNSPLAHLTVLPDTGKPLAGWHDRDVALSNIVAGIHRVIEELPRHPIVLPLNPTKAGMTTVAKGPLNNLTGEPWSDSALIVRRIQIRSSYFRKAPKWVIIPIIAAIVLVISGVGVALLAFHPSHPSPTQPKISITSAYNAQGLPVGADGTTFHVSGQHFAANSAITFLLDSTPLNEAQQTQSDGNGNVTADLAVTSAWGVGQHTLTAHDAGNTFTMSGIQIDVVQPGESNTPGPGGAPPDDASFTIQTNRQGTNANGTFFSSYTLIITGHPDPAGGSVCASRDTGTSIQEHGPSGSVTDNRTSIYLCSGTYKGGKFSYSEALQASTDHFSNGVTCTLDTPVQSFQYVTGSYTNQHNFSGNFTVSPIDRSMYTCAPAGYSTGVPGGQGTWTGTVSQS